MRVKWQSKQVKEFGEGFLSVVKNFVGQSWGRACNGFHKKLANEKTCTTTSTAIFDTHGTHTSTVRRSASHKPQNKPTEL